MAAAEAPDVGRTEGGGLLEAWAFWRRLDVPGHDTCRLLRRTDGGWRLEGTAVFRDELSSAIDYVIDCGADWVSRRASLNGWRGDADLAIEIEHDVNGEWLLNGAPLPGLVGCVDVDLGFTPATNLVQLRRLGLPIGGAANAPAAWFDISTSRLERLEQHYERLGETAYRYEAPRFEYAAELQVGRDGFVLEYPGLWRAES